MALDWLRRRSLPGDVDTARDAVGSPLPVRISIGVFVWAFALGTFESRFDVLLFLAGVVSGLAALGMYVVSMRRAGQEARRDPVFTNWLLYLPEPTAATPEVVAFRLLELGLAAVVVAVVVRIAIG